MAEQRRRRQKCQDELIYDDKIRAPEGDGIDGLRQKQHQICLLARHRREEHERTSGAGEDVAIKNYTLRVSSDYSCWFHFDSLTT